VPWNESGTQYEKQLWLGNEDDGRVNGDENYGDQGDLSVEIIDQIDAERGTGPLETCSQCKHDPHHRRTGKTKRDGKIPPETAAAGGWPDQQHEQWRQRQEKVDTDPECPCQHVTHHGSPPFGKAFPSQASYRCQSGVICKGQ